MCTYVRKEQVYVGKWGEDREVESFTTYLNHQG